jgi:hypothetical protein
MHLGSVRMFWAVTILIWGIGDAAAACAQDPQSVASDRDAAVREHLLKAGAGILALNMLADRPTGQNRPGMTVTVATQVHDAPKVAMAARRRLKDPDSTYAGNRIAIGLVVRAAYDAGFRSEDTLLTAVAVAIGESGLWTAARNWKPEYGFRPASDEIGVRGPSSVWSEDGRQIHSDRGLWQLSSYWWPDFTDSVSDNPVAAARIAFVLSDSGSDFCLWDSYAYGSAQRHYDEAYKGWPPLRPIVEAFLSQKAAATAQPPAADVPAP